MLPFFELPGELRNQIYDYIIDNRDEPLPSVVVPRFCINPTLPKQFQDEMSERLRISGDLAIHGVYLRVHHT